MRSTVFGSTTKFCPRALLGPNAVLGQQSLDVRARQAHQEMVTSMTPWLSGAERLEPRRREVDDPAGVVGLAVVDHAGDRRPGREVGDRQRRPERQPRAGAGARPAPPRTRWRCPVAVLLAPGRSSVGGGRTAPSSWWSAGSGAWSSVGGGVGRRGVGGELEGELQRFGVTLVCGRDEAVAAARPPPAPPGAPLRERRARCPEAGAAPQPARGSTRADEQAPPPGAVCPQTSALLRGHHTRADQGTGPGIGGMLRKGAPRPANVALVDQCHDRPIPSVSTRRGDSAEGALSGASTKPVVP